MNSKTLNNPTLADVSVVSDLWFQVRGTSDSGDNRGFVVTYRI